MPFYFEVIQLFSIVVEGFTHIERATPGYSLYMKLIKNVEISQKKPHMAGSCGGILKKTATDA